MPRYRLEILAHYVQIYEINASSLSQAEEIARANDPKDTEACHNDGDILAHQVWDEDQQKWVFAPYPEQEEGE